MRTTARRDCPPTPALQRVLDDAAAPGYDAELVGVHAAVLAFATTPYAPAHAVSWSLARFVATPVAALVAVSSLGGGVALAAATGSLPDAVQGIAAKLGAPAPDQPGTRAPDPRTPSRDEPRPGTGAAPTQTGEGRCTAVTVGGKDGGAGRALQSAPLSAAVATGCPYRAAPGSRRSETAQDRLADKPGKPGKPGASDTPVRATTPRPADGPRRADQGGRADGPTRAAKPVRADKPAAKPPEKPVSPQKPTSPEKPTRAARPVPVPRPVPADEPAPADKPVTAPVEKIRATAPVPVDTSSATPPEAAKR